MLIPTTKTRKTTPRDVGIANISLLYISTQKKSVAPKKRKKNTSQL